MQNNNIIGYKKAQNNVLVILEIPYDAKHNIDRKNIIDKQYAKYRCSHAKVIDIIDLNNNTSIDKAYSLHYPIFIYELGQELICDNFDTNLEKLCSRRIHFFLDKDRAILYNTKIEGENKDWHDNGQLARIFFIQNGLRHGECKSWHDNGQLARLCFYQNDKIQGEYKLWHDNGILRCLCFYQNNKNHGEYKEWHNNGQLKYHTYYMDNMMHGEFKSWNNNSQLLIQCSYSYGGIYGEYKQWNG